MLSKNCYAQPKNGAPTKFKFYGNKAGRSDPSKPEQEEMFSGEKPLLLFAISRRQDLICINLYLR